MKRTNPNSKFDVVSVREVSVLVQEPEIKMLQIEYLQTDEFLVEYLILDIEEKSASDVLYLCDGKKCPGCATSGGCKRTSDITHAKNFEFEENGEFYVEKMEVK